MKKFALILAASGLFTWPACAGQVASTPHAGQAGATPEMARSEQEAREVTIIRDNWGIAHVYGKTDAHAVFGMICAQAEDDFKRIETNYLNGMGRLAEAPRESKNFK